VTSAELRDQHRSRLAELQSQVRAHNEGLDRIAAGTAERERLAVSEYFDLVLGRMADPPDFPRAQRAAYVPESEMLAVDWDLPQFGAVPTVHDIRRVRVVPGGAAGVLDRVARHGVALARRTRRSTLQLARRIPTPDRWIEPRG
jgi:hypothetical protein